MSVIGSDSRQVVTTFGTFPISTVVAVDILDQGGPSFGSGITIAPNHVLTAGHNAFDTSTNTNATSLRTTTSANQNALNSRSIGAQGDPPANVTNVNFLADYDTTEATSDDIALFTTSDAPIAANNVIGLIAFVDPVSAEGFTIDTAGYPGDNVSGNIPGNSGVFVRDLVISPGTALSPGDIVDTSSGGRFFYSPDVDTFGGQSGSGIWHTLDGDSTPRVLGVHTQGTGANPFFSSLLGLRNSGVLITTDIYNEIVAQVAADSGTANADDLPENAIIGTDPSSFLFFQTASGEDNIVGSYRRERILGQGGNDTLLGAGADDRLEGGDGVDQALFSDPFVNYDFTITDPLNPAFEFVHARGTMADGTDTTQDIEFGVFEFVDANNDGNADGDLFFVPLQVDPDDNTQLRDGPLITPEDEIFDAEGNQIGTITVESPAWMFDGNVDYTLTLGSEQGTLFNFAYIIDVSGSVAGTPLEEAQNAFMSLTESLIDSDAADNSLFVVVPFSDDASLLGPLSPTDTISTVQGLTAGGATNFNAALSEAAQFFSVLATPGASNIVYFLSDGNPTAGGSDFSANAAALQALADVRAFGIGEVDIDNLNIVDSGDAEFLTDPSDLDDAFVAATVDSSTVERIDVRLGGMVIDTITPDQLTETTLGLEFEGTIEGLEVTRTAENEIDFDLVFNNGTPTATLSYTITTGQEQVIEQTNNGTEEVIIFSVNQSDFTAESVTNESISREINGNDLDNVITIEDGANTVFGNDGNDSFILSGGLNLINGGDGTDTVVINTTQAEAGEISQTGNITSIGAENTLIDVEFIEFDDVRLAVETLTVTPILSLAELGISVPEGNTDADGNADSTAATFTINLSSVTTEDVVIDFLTRSTAATADTDFVDTEGQLIIGAGESSGEIVVDVLGDTEVEGDEVVFLDLTVVSGATFANNALTEIAGVNILDDDSAVTLSITAEDPTVVEGNPDTASTGLVLTLDRFGGLSETDTIEVQIVAAGSNPAQASDFIDGFSTTEVTFAPGESSQTIEIPIATDAEIEEDETFGISLTSTSGSATVPTDATVFTILDDDDVTDTPTPVISDTSDQDDNDTLVLDQGGTFTFTITENQNDVDFSQQLVVLSDTIQLPIISTLGNASGLPGTFSTADLTVDATLATAGSFQFGTLAPNSNTITPLALNDVTADGFNLSGSGLEIAVTIPEVVDAPPLITRTTIDGEDTLGVELTDGINNFSDAEITIDATLHREAAFDNTIGFYLVDAANEGAVIDPLTGQAIAGSATSNRLEHLQAVIDNSLLNSTAPTDNQALDINETISISNLGTDVQLLLVPYIIADGDISDLSSNFDELYTTFLGTNVDGVDHIRLLSNDALGFEDIAGGGDNDFDDIVVQLNAVDVTVV